jgi:hypothetical protein
VIVPVVLALALALTPASAQHIEDASGLREAVYRALPLELNREVDDRLPRVTIDANGDVTVVFAMRDATDLTTLRQAALEDTLAVLRAVYSSPDAARVTSTTALATFNVIGKRNTAREQPMLRAVVSADSAARLALGPNALPSIADAWWLHAALGDMEALRAPPPLPGVQPSAVIPVDAEGRPHQALSDAEVRHQVDLMLLHLNESLFALSGNDVRVARSQFKQFFEEWDRAEEETSELYPEHYEQLDVELERAEIALLHRQPEDLNAARFALRALRAGLLQIAADLESR